MISLPLLLGKRVEDEAQAAVAVDLAMRRTKLMEDWCACVTGGDVIDETELRASEESALIAAFSHHDFGPLAALLRTHGSDLQQQSYAALADHLEGIQRLKDGRGEGGHDFEKIARQFYWLVLAKGMGTNEAQRAIAVAPTQKPPSPKTIERACKSEIGQAAERETRLKLVLYDTAELRAYEAELFEEWSETSPDQESEQAQILRFRSNRR